MSIDLTNVQRVIGFDSHPDTFTAAIVQGKTPASAILQQTFDKIPMTQLQAWAKKHTTPEDLFVLEASGNSFYVVRTLEAIQRKAYVLESCHLGKLKEGHANNDKISAVRIAKACLAGTAKIVWVPDLRTQEWRDLFHTYRKATKRTTQMRNRIKSYLSDHGVRLPQKMPLATQPEECKERIQKSHTWTPSQWQLIEGLLMELNHAEAQRRHWRSLIAQIVLADPTMLSLIRLCGVREMVAFACGAIIGDIKRFAKPGSLVKYIGLNPAFDDSGKETWTGRVGHGRGRQDLRSLFVEAAQAIVRCANNPLAKWGKKLLARKGSRNLVVAAVARKLVVSVWYLWMGCWTKLKEVDARLEIKIDKIMTVVAPCKKLPDKVGKSRATLREEIRERLKSGTYMLDKNKKYTPKAKVVEAAQA